MANTQHPSDPPRRTPVDRRGLGQSGYAAGRQADDLALEHVAETHHVSHPGIDSDGLGTDDRFTGRGGTRRCDDTLDDIESARPGREPDGEPEPVEGDRSDPVEPLPR